MCFRWTKTETEELKRQISLGINIYDVKITGRLWDGIRRKAKRVKLIAPLRNPPITDAQKEKLRELRKQGLTVWQISEFDMLGLPRRTVSAIQHAFSRMEFVDANRSKGARNRKCWLNGEKQAFDTFLRRNSLKLAPQQIAKRFGVVAETVTARQRQLRVRPSLTANRQISYFKKKIREANRVRSRKMLLNFEEYVAKKEKQLEALAEKLRGQKRLFELQEKHCKGCGKIWPRHKKFFFHATYKTSFGTSWHFVHDCKICASKQCHQEKVAKYEKKYSQKLE